MAQVVFDYGAWSTRYPELAGSVSSDLANLYFAEAQLYLSNDDCSIEQNISLRAILFNMLVAHIASLNVPVSDPAQARLVGRILTGTQGSVTVTLAPLDGNVQDWFGQTRYGLAFWQATARLRTMQYVPGRRRRFDPWVC
jgi:hypothetical protein